MTKHSVLYFGTLEWGSTSLFRMQSLSKCVERLYAVDTRIVLQEYVTRSNWQRIQIRLGRGHLIRNLGDLLLREIKRYKPTLVWIDQGVCITPEILDRAHNNDPNMLLIHYTPDPLSSLGPQNCILKRSLPIYDICITTKQRDIESYYKLGSKSVLLSGKGFDIRVHAETELTIEEKPKYAGDVMFAGNMHGRRANSLMRLAKDVDCSINIYGRGWDRNKKFKSLFPLFRGWLFAQEYSKAIRSAKICLGFLATEFGDDFTARSLEIPAAGGFLLAQRTKAHLQMFEEDLEAAYFGNDDELVEKVKFYLEKPELRERIAEAGRRKVLSSGLTWDNQMRICINEIAVTTNLDFHSQ